MHRFVIPSAAISIVNPAPKPTRDTRELVLPRLEEELRRRNFGLIEDVVGRIYVLPFRPDKVRIDNPRTRNKRRALELIRLAQANNLPLRVYAAKGAWLYYSQLEVAWSANRSGMLAPR